MAISDLLKSAREADATAQESDDAAQDAGDELPQDARPARSRARGRSASGASQPPARVTAAQRRAVHDALEMMITLPAGVAALRDPVCGGALVEQADAIVEKLTPIVCRNAGMLAWFTEGAGYLDWLGLATALWPVGRTFWAHHVTHSIGGEEDGHGAGADVADFSQYTAPAFVAA